MTLTVPSFEAKGGTTFYRIEARWRDATWSTEKRYSQFDVLHGDLRHGSRKAQLPSLPGKQLLQGLWPAARDSKDANQQRRAALEKYIQILTARPRAACGHR